MIIQKQFIHFLTATIFFFAFCSSARSDDGQPSKHIFDNGLTVLISEMPSSPVVSVYALVKAGSATEGKFLGAGISHFLEHMLFKGTHGRNVGELASRIQSVGGTINAATSYDYTIYTITVPHESFDVALDILSDMLMNATMNPEEVERERKVIFGEMRLRRDDPDRILSELVFQNVYIRHPYRHPIIGYESLLAEVTPEDLVEYYRSFYTPNNIILSVAGNIDDWTILPKIQEAFKGFKRTRAITRNLPEEPTQISGRRYEEEYPTDLTRLSMSFSGMSLLHPDLYALDALAKILGEGKSSRLYVDVYKAKGLVHSISASNYTPMDKGMFEIDCLLELTNVEPVIQEVLRHIDQIKKTGVKPEELDKAKQQARSEHVFHQQTASSVTYAQVVDEAFAGDPHFSQKYVEAISHVTNEDIKRVANRYLVDSGLTVVVLKPKQGESVKPIESQETDRGLIQKHVLKNGLTVLLKEDHTFPLVSIRLSANGGIRQESARLNGLSHLTASTWIKGSKRYSANQIAEISENLGMRLDSFSGRSSFGVSLELLTEHLSTAFSLLKDLVFDPTFPQEEIGKVKEDMKAMIRQRNDDIFQSTAHVLKETLFQTHPFRLEKEGTLESVEAINREDILAFYDQFAVSRNMVLSVFGDIHPENTLKDIEQIFRAMKDRNAVLKSHEEDPPHQVREQALTMNKEQAMVMAGFQGVKLGDADYHGLEVLTTILGSSFSGRIFTNIREQLGEAYTLGGNFVPSPDMGLIYFYVLTTDQEVDKVKELLKKEIQTLQAELVSAQELKDVKTYLKGTFKASQETNADLSFTVSLDELYGLGFENYQHYDNRIDGVTEDDIRRLARQYLDLNKMAIAVTRPNNNSDE